MNSKKFSPGAPTPQTPQVEIKIWEESGEPRVRKEQELRHKGERSLWVGGWDNDLMSGICFNEEWNKQDKTGIFILDLLKTMHNRFP